VTPALSRLLGRVAPPPDQAGPRPTGSGKEVVKMSKDITLILAITLMVAVIRSRT
jgi:hypothetical protein